MVESFLSRLEGGGKGGRVGEEQYCIVGFSLIWLILVAQF